MSIEYKAKKELIVTISEVEDIAIYMELIWVLKNKPASVGLTKKDFKASHRDMIDELYDGIEYPEDYNVEL